MESEIKNRRSISDKLSKFGYKSGDDFIEVTEWTNGEGLKKPKIGEKISKAILQYDLQDNFIKEWSSFPVTIPTLYFHL